MTWPGGAWPAARAAKAAEVVLFGDSITSGQSATDYRSRSYAQQLRAVIRSLYGNGGSGFDPHHTGAAGGATSTASGTTVFAPDGPNGDAYYWSGAGRWSKAVSGGEVAVFLRRRTTYGSARWRVDGGPWQTVACAGTEGYIRAAVTGLASGSHTIDVEAVSGTVAVFGVEGTNPAGSRLHLMGLGGRTSGGNAFSSPTAEDLPAFRAATIGRWAPHLLVVNVGVNDSNTGTTSAAAYETNVGALITAARAARADCDVVLVANHLGKFADNSYDAMRTALYTLADTHGAGVVDLDLWARTLPDGTTTARTATPPDGTSWGRWSTWGWFSGATDSVHPGDTGHRVLADVLTEVLTA